MLPPLKHTSFLIGKGVEYVPKENNELADERWAVARPVGTTVRHHLHPHRPTDTVDGKTHSCHHPGREFGDPLKYQT